MAICSIVFLDRTLQNSFQCHLLETSKWPALYDAGSTVSNAVRAHMIISSGNITCWGPNQLLHKCTKEEESNLTAHAKRGSSMGESESLNTPETPAQYQIEFTDIAVPSSSDIDYQCQQQFQGRSSCRAQYMSSVSKGLGRPIA